MICTIGCYLPMEKGVVFHLNKSEYSLPKNTDAKFGWKWPSVLEEKMKWLKFTYDVYTPITTDKSPLNDSDRWHLIWVE